MATPTILQKDVPATVRTKGAERSESGLDDRPECQPNIVKAAQAAWAPPRTSSEPAAIAEGTAESRKNPEAQQAAVREDSTRVTKTNTYNSVEPSRAHDALTAQKSNFVSNPPYYESSSKPVSRPAESTTPHTPLPPIAARPEQISKTLEPTTPNHTNRIEAPTARVEGSRASETAILNNAHRQELATARVDGLGRDAGAVRQGSPNSKNGTARVVGEGSQRPTAQITQADLRVANRAEFAPQFGDRQNRNVPIEIAQSLRTTSECGGRGEHFQRLVDLDQRMSRAFEDRTATGSGHFTKANLNSDHYDQTLRPLNTKDMLEDRRAGFTSQSFQSVESKENRSLNFTRRLADQLDTESPLKAKQQIKDVPPIWIPKNSNRTTDLVLLNDSSERAKVLARAERILSQIEKTISQCDKNQNQAGKSDRANSGDSARQQSGSRQAAHEGSVGNRMAGRAGQGGGGSGGSDSGSLATTKSQSGSGRTPWVSSGEKQTTQPGRRVLGDAEQSETTALRIKSSTPAKPTRTGDTDQIANGRETLTSKNPSTRIADATRVQQDQAIPQAKQQSQSVIVESGNKPNSAGGGGTKTEVKGTAILSPIEANRSTDRAVAGAGSSQTEKVSLIELNAAIEKLLAVKVRYPAPGESFVGSGIRTTLRKVDLQERLEDQEFRSPKVRILGASNDVPSRSERHMDSAISAPPTEDRSARLAQSGLTAGLTTMSDWDAMLDGFELADWVDAPHEQDVNEATTTTATPCSSASPQPTSYVTKYGDTLNSVAITVFGKPLSKLSERQQLEICKKVPLVSLQETDDPSSLKVLPSQSLRFDAA